MKVRGHVVVELRDSQKKLKNFRAKHNTITEYGKAAALFTGLDQHVFPINTIYTGVATPVGIKYADYNYNVEIELLESLASSLAGKSYIKPDDSDLIGYANHKETGATSAKEGLKIKPVSRTTAGAITAGRAGNRIAVSYTWTGIEGSLNTIAMKTPYLGAYRHKLPGMLGTTYQFISPLKAGVPLSKIALNGSSYNKLLDLDTLALTDFTPSSSYTAPSGIFGAFEFNGYLLEFSYNRLTVTNKNTGDSYYENWTGIKGGFIKNNELFILEYSSSLSSVGYKLSKVTVNDVETQATQVTLSDYIDSSWIPTSDSIISKMYIMQYSDGLIFQQYYESVSSSMTYTGYFTDDLLKSKTGLSRFGAYSSNFNVCCYFGTFIDFSTSEIIPFGQAGNMLSYFDVSEDSFEIETTDILTVTYTYEVEDELV